MEEVEEFPFLFSGGTVTLPHEPEARSVPKLEDLPSAATNHIGYHAESYKTNMIWIIPDGKYNLPSQ